MITLHKKSWITCFVLFVIVGISLFLWFILDVLTLYHSGRLQPTRNLYQQQIHNQIYTPDAIETWMTFSYINYIFKLPPTYLSESLGIQDARYPNIEIRRYTQANKLDSANFLMSIRNSIAQFIN